MKILRKLLEFKGDVILRLADNDYRIEVKRKQDAGRWYALINKGCVHIDGFCYFMTQAQFAELIHGIDFGIVSVVPCRTLAWANLDTQVYHTADLH